MSDHRLRGACRALYCIDVAWGIDLRRAGDTLTASRSTTFQHKSHVPAGEGLARPLRLDWRAESLKLGTHRTESDVEVAIYDHGTLCITWTLFWEGPLDSLVPLSADLYDNSMLRERSGEIAIEISRLVALALDRPLLSPLVEDYAIFQVRPLAGAEGWSPGEDRRILARILRAEPGELSAQEVDDALASSISYGPHDLCLVDWLGAVLLGEDTEDERFVLEIATVELLALRILDARLDVETREAYEILTRPHTPWRALMHQRRELEHVSRIQADDALLHEGIDNALKLFGDDYLARLYRAASVRFHFDDWDTAIQRKLEVLRSIYQGLAGNAANRRSEILEWIIIVLIAVDIVLYFTPWR